MTRREIDKMDGPTGSAILYYDPEFNEFIVRIVGKPAADYFTDDEADARATMERMVGYAPR